MFSGLEKPLANLSAEQISWLKKICRLNYWQLPDDMRLGTHPDQSITLYKGALHSFKQFPYSEAVKNCSSTKS